VDADDARYSRTRLTQRHRTHADSTPPGRFVPCYGCGPFGGKRAWIPLLRRKLQTGARAAQRLTAGRKFGKEHHAAVNEQGRAGDVVGSIRNQPSDCLGNIIG
jgi:hypothetical protein